MASPDFRIVVAAGAFAAVPDQRREVADRTFEIVGRPLGTPDEVEKSTADADCAVVGLHRLGDAEIERLGPNFRVISRAGIGLDSIDLQAARARGVAVIHQPDYATEEVASHAVALFLALNRRLFDTDRIARGGWKGRRTLNDIRALSSLTVGVVGAGKIGRASLARLRPLAGRVLFFDRETIEVDGAEAVASLDELLVRSDAVLLHAPLTAETRHMIDAAAIQRMPSHAILINVSRGELVDSAALATALEEGLLGGAGLDVFEEEPLRSDHPLASAPNLIMSPHVAFLSSASLERLERQSIDDACAYLINGTVHGGRIATP